MAISAQEREHLKKQLDANKLINGPESAPKIYNTVEGQELDSRRGLKVVEGAQKQYRGKSAQQIGPTAAARMPATGLQLQGAINNAVRMPAKLPATASAYAAASAPAIVTQEVQYLPVPVVPQQEHKVQAVTNGKDAVILEENPSNRSVEVIPHPEPTLTEQQMTGMGGSLTEVIPHPEPTLTKQSVTPAAGPSTELIPSDEPTIVERVIA